MNYKALLLGFLLLLPMGLVTLSTASLPTPPGPGTPTIYITPPQKFYGPCVNGTTFTENVVLWDQSATKEDVYGFDIGVTWTGLDITLLQGSYTSPWATFFQVANYTADSYYHLALTATPPSKGLTDVNATILSLTFQVERELCWPEQITGKFDFWANSTLVGDGNVSKTITDAEFDGTTYGHFTLQPNMDLKSAAANATGFITEKCVSNTIDVEVDLTNVTNVYGFGFLMTYNPCYLETDAQKITPKPTFAGPYEYTAVYVGDGVTSYPAYGVLPKGDIFVAFVRPSEKPGLCGAAIAAVDIIFHTIDTVDVAPILPTAAQSSIALYYSFIMVKCSFDGNNPYGWSTGTPGEYNSLTSGGIGSGWLEGVIGYTPNWYLNNAGLGYGTGTGWNPITGLGLIQGAALQYIFKPSPYDLNLDCVVDVQDLKMLLSYYGKTTLPHGNSYGDLTNVDGTVDVVNIFDFVQVAKNFGPVDP